ncbi:MAG TPA: 2-phospho-L-lactate guanylyltransferase [Gaiellaceae bacterium]|nr:2-phospho-L-lactate guanylyltransferase [Gaiellaceae bacterium]
MLAIVPVKGLDGAKTRLVPLLSPAERAELVRAMLAAVLAACAESESVASTLVVTPEPELAPVGVEVLLDSGNGHAAALASALADRRAADGALVVMADCPLATGGSLDRLARAATPVALVRALDRGMNALALSSPGLFEPLFGVPDAALRTVERARAAGIEPAVVDEPLLAFDVDRPTDLKRFHPEILSRTRASA